MKKFVISFVVVCIAFAGYGQVAIKVKPVKTHSVSTAIQTIPIIAGNSYNLKASGAYTYSWSPSTNLNHTTGNLVTANPGVTTTYIVTGQDKNGVAVSSKKIVLSVSPSSGAAKKATLKNEKLGSQRLSLAVSTYTNNTSIVKDEDPPGLTQYKADLTIPIHKIAGIDSDSEGFQNIILFRNVLISPLIRSTKSFFQVDSFSSNRHANLIDMFQYANVRLPVELNLLTYIAHRNSTDYFHVYADLLGGAMFGYDTSTYKTEFKSQLQTALFYGFAVSAKTESGMPSFPKGLTIQVGITAFGINSLSNSFAPDLAVQNRNLSDTILRVSNSTKKVLEINKWFASADLTLQYTFQKTVSNIDSSGKLVENKTGEVNRTTTTTATTSTVFLRFSLYQNLAGFSNHYSNSYLQVQLGYSLDIGTILHNWFNGQATNGQAAKNKTTGPPIMYNLN